MDFPITSLLDLETSYAWLLRHFHPNGLHCVHCGVSVNEARHFRTTKQSQVPVYRCKACQGIYTLYSGTVFQGTHLRPQKIVLLLRGIFKGESSLSLKRELKLARQTAHHYRHAVQANVLRAQPQTALPDAVTETDELYQHAGEKRRKAR
jgi:predicted SprT family Zn-dependent metalloprotease